VLYPVYLALEALFGRGLAAATDFTGDGGARYFPLISSLLGYLVMMYTHVARGTFRDLEALRPILQGGEATYSELRRQLTHFERRRLWIGSLVGLAFSCLLWELGSNRWAALIPAGDFTLEAACNFLILSAFWITGGRGTVYLIDSVRLYSQIGERHVNVDLLDLTPLSPLTSHGLRIVLFLVIVTGAAVISLIVGNPSALGAALLLSCFWNILLAPAAFVLPVRGLRRQIRARKAEELARVRCDIRRNRELAAESGTESAEAGAKLPGLLAYMNQIESVREWPFDTPTLTRFFLYVAIPLGSWIGGALVERLLGAALD